jgi:hypothetical protein
MGTQVTGPVLIHSEGYMKRTSSPCRGKAPYSLTVAGSMRAPGYVLVAIPVRSFKTRLTDLTGNGHVHSKQALFAGIGERGTLAVPPNGGYNPPLRSRFLTQPS